MSWKGMHGPAVVFCFGYFDTCNQYLVLHSHKLLTGLRYLSELFMFCFPFWCTASKILLATIFFFLQINCIEVVFNGKIIWLVYHAIKQWFARTLFASWKVMDEITNKSLIEKVYYVIIWFNTGIHSLIVIQCVYSKQSNNVTKRERGSGHWKTKCLSFCKGNWKVLFSALSNYVHCILYSISCINVDTLEI